MRSGASLLACGILAGTMLAGAIPAAAGIRTGAAQGGPCPGNRAWPSLAYDPATQDSVLFGGTNWTTTTFRGTWTWNGTAWTQQHPATSPTARRGAAMAYDGATGQLLLFGGDPSPTMTHTRFDGDTWTWNGSDWTRVTPAAIPAERENGVMTYDSLRDRIVLFGGDNAHSPTGTNVLGSLWEWDGTTWAREPA